VTRSDPVAFDLVTRPGH